MHRIRSPGAASSRRTASAAAASTTCSQLSRITTAAAPLSRSNSAASPPVTSSAAITVSSDVVGRRRGSRAGPARRRRATPASARPVAIATRRLADPARPDDLDEPLAVRAGRDERGDLGLAADELGRQRRQVPGRRGAARGDRRERRVVVEDLLLELLQLRSGVEPELVGQPVRTRW